MRQFNPKLRSDKSALLVIDVQEQFCNGSAWSSDLPIRVSKFIEAVSLSGVLCVYTKTIGDPDRIPENVSRFRRVRGYRSDAPSESPKAKLCPMFVPDGSLIIEKPCFDAFAYTPLNRCLHEREIQNVLLIGVMTDVCVDATARRAVMEGYNTYILEDLIAAPDAESAKRSLAFFERYYGYVVKSCDIFGEAV
jgi:nicotinamidase-related amidase